MIQQKFSKWFLKSYPSLKWNRLAPSAQRRIAKRFESLAKKKEYYQRLKTFRNLPLSVRRAAIARKYSINISKPEWEK